MNTFFVSVDISEAVMLITEIIDETDGRNKCIDKYYIEGRDGNRCTTLVLRKSFFRIYGCVIVTIVIDNFEGKTRIHTVCEDEFNFGASKKFTKLVMKQFKDIIIE